MLGRFRSLAVSVIQRGNVVKAFKTRSSSYSLPPPTPETSDGTGKAAPPVSWEYLNKLQAEYKSYLSKINSATNKLNPRSRHHNALWASTTVEQYFELIVRAYTLYTQLIPFWDQSLLPRFDWYGDHRTVRTKSMNQIASSPSLSAYAKNLRGSKAAVLLSLLQEELDDFFDERNRPALLILLRDLSETSGELPSTFWLTGVKRSTRRAYGGDAEIWVGSHAGQEVAIRDFWFPSEMSPDRLQKIIRREIVANRQLTHQNVLRLVGVFSEPDRPMAVVTPWMPNGLASIYLQSHPVELLHILQGAIDGMQYLHSLTPPIIHGSMSPRNILVNADGDAVIRDLGITRVRMEVIKSVDERIASFSPRYQAPELMRAGPSSSSMELDSPSETPSAGEEREAALTAAGDVYSLSMTFYHLIAHIEPFSSTTHPSLTSPASIIRAVLDGERPLAPPPSEATAIEAGGSIEDRDMDELWSLLREMWAHDPMKRPSMESAAARVMKLENRKSCRGCLELHRGTECLRASDRGACTECQRLGVECIQDEDDLTAGRGYGLNAHNRQPTDGGYYITTLELPPSPEGALVPGQALETRRVRLVPFQWQRRRRTSSQQLPR